ncbi:MAG: class I SAM-dependent rRNA methyltransferase [Rhodospirillales bacterium]
MAPDLPTLSLLPGQHKRLAQGYPWVYSNEVAMNAEARALPPGSLVRLLTAKGESLGLALFNRNALVAARLIARSPKQRIDAAFFAKILQRALTLRDGLYREPFYRLIHAEADGLPALIVDRYGESLVVQLNAAGMETLKAPLLEALEGLLKPRCILLNDEAGLRQAEGLPAGERLIKGQPDDPLPLRENGLACLARISGGQKTGWFYDQRDNRAWIARFAAGRRVLDAYCYAGGFALNAAQDGASEVLGLDRSESALALAREAAALNGLETRCRFEKEEVFAGLGRLAREGQLFDLMIVDPPAFVKGRKELAQGLKGYRKLARLAAQVTAPQGLLFMASCSQPVEARRFTEAVALGLQDAGRQSRILRLSGAAADHPTHPLLPESAYLKALTLALD